MPNYVSKIKPDGMGGTEYNIKDAELREVVQAMQDEVAGTQTATGNPITLTDASETYAQGLSVEFAPKQDLHGQSAPYVGGAGKNKLPLTVERIKALNTTGTWSGNVYTYKNVSYSILTDNGNNVTGLGISGTNTERSDLFLPPPSLSGLSNIAFSARFISGSPIRALRFQMYNGTGTARDRYINADPTESTWSVDGEYKTVVLSAYAGSGDIVITLQIESGTTATPFAPWENICPISGYEGVEVTTADSDTDPTQSRTASVTFGQTVYGGNSNLTDGGTSDEYEYADDLDTWNWTAEGEGYFFAIVSDAKLNGKITCSMYKGVQKLLPDNGEISVTNSQATPLLRIKDPTCVGYTASEFAAHISGCQLAYELTEPTQLSTSPTDLKLLQGTNNLTTNGTTITLDYIPNNSIGDAVKASEEYTDRAVGRVAPKATLIDTWMISEEADTISVDLSSYDCNFFLLEYLFNSKRGTTLIPRPSGGSFSASVVTYNNGTAYYVELTYNPTTKELAYTSNVTSQFGILAIYTI